MGGWGEGEMGRRGDGGGREERKIHTSARPCAASNTVTEWPERAHWIAVERPERPAPTIAMERVGGIWGTVG